MITIQHKGICMECFEDVSKYDSGNVLVVYEDETRLTCELCMNCINIAMLSEMKKLDTITHDLFSKWTGIPQN